jgi:hypothetical protein
MDVIGHESGGAAARKARLFCLSLVCDATVYKLCATNALEHVRVLNSIRVPAEWLRAFVAARSTRL